MLRGATRGEGAGAGAGAGAVKTGNGNGNDTGDGDGDGSNSGQQHPCPRGKVTKLVVAGGVAANAYLRERIAGVAAAAGVEAVYPPVRYCTDNAVMVAWAGAERLRCGLVDDVEEADFRPRWPLGPQVKWEPAEAPPKKKKNKNKTTKTPTEETTPEQDK